LSETFSNTKGVIWVGVIGLKTCFQNPIRTNHNKGYEIDFAQGESPFVLPWLFSKIRVIRVIRGGRKKADIVYQHP
jgi:hypothetical protein